MMIRGFEKVVDAPEDTKLPKRSTKYSAGYDFFAPEDIVIPAHNFSKLVFLNVKAYMQDDEYLDLSIRSSLAVKNGLTVAQGKGVVDADYYNNPKNDGNICVMFYNRSNRNMVILKGEKCCQGIFHKYLLTDDDEADGIRTGGYGSTGK